MTEWVLYRQEFKGGYNPKPYPGWRQLHLPHFGQRLPQYRSIVIQRGNLHQMKTTDTSSKIDAGIISSPQGPKCHW